VRRSTLVRLYPVRWRQRYEDEFGAVLDQERLTIRVVLDVIRGAAAAYLAAFPLIDQEELAMTHRRIETVAALFAALLVLPSLVLLASGAIRAMQPVQYEPARTADAIVGWFASFHDVRLVLVGAPLVALVLGTAALWRRLSDDPGLRADVGLFLAVTGRLVRRPVLVGGLFAVAGSLAVLVFIADHAIAG
jgi:hypothetical protein